MKRLALLVLAGSLALALVGCQAPGAPAGGGSSPATAPATVKVDPYAAIPDDGAHEQAAYDALPAAVKTAEQATLAQKREFTDLSTGKATLTAYMVQAKVGRRVTLFEVRGDGEAYELYRYPTAPDPAKLFWQDATVASGAYLVKPAGPGETSAAAAVRDIVAWAAPGEAATIRVYGYVFHWVRPDGTAVHAPGGGPFTISIDPKGNASSWSM